MARLPKERSRSRIGLRPLPTIGGRVKPDDYARFYANVDTMQRKTVHIGFRVKVNLTRMGNKFYYKQLVKTINLILSKWVPLGSFHGQVYPTFKDLYNSDWVKVRKVRWYKAGIKYGR